MAQEAGALLRQFADHNALRAMETAVAAYVATEDDPTVVDWEFLAQRNMIESADVDTEAKGRHQRAQKAVADAGYVWPATGRQKKKDAAEAEPLAEAAAALTPEMESELAEILRPRDGS